MTNNNEHASALRDLLELKFALHELVLYLDTHPDNRKALSLYKTYKKKYDEMYAMYELNHAPMTAFGVKHDRWTWTEGAWPWQNEKGDD